VLYGEPEKIALRLKFTDGALALEIADNGRGFDMAAMRQMYTTGCRGCVHA
jgi:signal transduction histidine kinase